MEIGEVFTGEGGSFPIGEGLQKGRRFWLGVQRLLGGEKKGSNHGLP